MDIRGYADALRYIYSFADYERQMPRQREFQHLENMLALLSALGNPHERLAAIHIAGTKGKGSTSAMISGILNEAGQHVGMYTSPHLNTHRERYRLNGSPVSEESFTRTLQALQPTIERVRRERRLTTFEVAVALAFTLFAEEQVDWAVIEVGLGGRLDTTNVITPEVSVITSISLDHVEVLGDTIQQIAAEKAGIIKPHIPVVIGPQTQEALGVLHDQAQRKESPALLVNNLVHATDRRSLGIEGQEFRLTTDIKLGTETLNGGRVHLNLMGQHQVDNALTAIVAATSLDQGRTRLQPVHVPRALSKVTWPGRFEVVQTDVPLVLDGAHNPDSIRKLLRTVGEVFPNLRPRFVFGSGRGHDARNMLRELKGYEVILCRSTHPRSMSLEDLSALAREEVLQYCSAGTVAEALHAARRDAEVVVVCGTLFVVAEAREALGLAGAVDPVRS